jgi:hypothetical protein
MKKEIILSKIDDLKNERWQQGKTASQIDAIDAKIEILEELINLTPKTTAFYPTSAHWDNVEIHPMQNIDSPELCEEDEAEFYSIFLHLTSGGLKCIADLPSKELAYSLKETMLRFLAGGKQR